MEGSLTLRSTSTSFKIRDQDGVLGNITERNIALATCLLTQVLTW